MISMFILWLKTWWTINISCWHEYKKVTKWNNEPYHYCTKCGRIR